MEQVASYRMDERKLKADWYFVLCIIVSTVCLGYMLFVGVSSFNKWNLQEAGYPEAQYALADSLYRKGSIKEAQNWYEKAAIQGHTQAQYNLGILLEREGELKAAESWLLKAAENLNVDAQFRLAEILAKQRRFEEAERWLNTAEYNEQQREFESKKLQNNKGGRK